MTRRARPRPAAPPAEPAGAALAALEATLASLLSVVPRGTPAPADLKAQAAALLGPRVDVTHIADLGGLLGAIEAALRRDAAPGSTPVPAGGAVMQLPLDAAPVPPPEPALRAGANTPARTPSGADPAETPHLVVQRTRSGTSHRQFDLFLPLVSDLPLKDEQELMERPFFSLAKSKRLKPIDYRSPDGSVWVEVTASQRFGMATIWDADILIWATTQLIEAANRKLNDVPRTLRFHPYELLKTIRRSAGGREYQLLRDALARLQSTVIRTNIRASGRKKFAQFSWLDDFTEVLDSDGNTREMTLTVSNWLYEGIVFHAKVLTINPDYFDITSGLGRVLYRIARKHAGRQSEGYTLTFPVLHEKTGSDEEAKYFNRRLKKLVEANDLPDYDMALTSLRGQPAVRFLNRAFLAGTAPAGAAKPARKSRVPRAVLQFPGGSLAFGAQGEAVFRAIAREHGGGWDVDRIADAFRQTLGSDLERVSGTVLVDRFTGFCKAYAARHGRA